MRIYPNKFSKKAIEIDLVGKQKAKEIQYTQYNQIVMCTEFYIFAVHSSTKMVHASDHT